MIFTKKTVFALLISSVSAERAPLERQLTEDDHPCGELAGCILWDKTAKVEMALKTEVELEGTDDKNYYCPKASERGWSVRCDTDYGEDGVIDEIKFTYKDVENGGDKVQDEYGEPRWMNGDSDEGGWINDVALLVEEGKEDKKLVIEGRQWAQSCFTATYKLTPKCGDGGPAPTPTDTDAPTIGPSLAPSLAPITKAPVYKPPNKKLKSCARASWILSWTPAVPAGVTIIARDPAKKWKKLKLTSKGGKSIMLTNEERLFFKAIKPNTPELRLVVDGAWGPWKSCQKNTPIGLDIDGSGAVERIDGDFEIDITGDGHIEHLSEWFAPSEGILISMIPFIKDGEVTGGNLFGDMGRTYADGYEKLGLLDKDGNSMVSGTELDGLAIWTDVNSNAHLDDGELSKLGDHGIVGLRTDDDANYASSAVLANGSEMYMEDLWFAR